jgi:EAL domain-containing protein (putative c-di-GMP-specific phosphodiesterase class I)
VGREITAALELDRFVLFAQEIRPLCTWNSDHSGAEPPHLEILVRMLDANGALISPMAFIPAAERYGLMPRIDRWVIATGVQDPGRMPNPVRRDPHLHDQSIGRLRSRIRASWISFARDCRSTRCPVIGWGSR